MVVLIAVSSLVYTLYYLRIIFKRKKNPSKWLYVILMFNCFMKFLIGYMNFPNTISYISDIILIWAVLETIYALGRRKINVSMNVIGCILIYLLVTLGSYIMNMYSPAHYLWGFRNNFRFFIFFVLSVIWLTKSDFYLVTDILYGFFIINILAVTYEFFFAELGSSIAVGDYISGLYSLRIDRGGNAALNWLCCIVCTCDIAKYLNKEKSLKHLLCTLLGAFYIVSLSEIKFFFVEIIFIVSVALVLSKKSVKSLTFILIAIISLNLGIKLLYEFFPSFDGFFESNTIISYVNDEAGYGHSGGMNRSNTVEYVLDNLLYGFPDKMFGVGLGNAEDSAIPILRTDFYARYGSTSYSFFMSSMVTVETGIMGLLSYIVILINNLITSVKLNSKECPTVKVVTIIISCLSLMMFFYNQSLKLETSGFMVYMIVAFAFIYNKNCKEDSYDYKKLKIRVRK